MSALFKEFFPSLGRYLFSSAFFDFLITRSSGAYHLLKVNSSKIKFSLSNVLMQYWCDDLTTMCYLANVVNISRKYTDCWVLQRPKSTEAWLAVYLLKPFESIADHLTPKGGVGWFWKKYLAHSSPTKKIPCEWRGLKTVSCLHQIPQSPKPP